MEKKGSYYSILGLYSDNIPKAIVYLVKGDYRLYSSMAANLRTCVLPWRDHTHRKLAGKFQPASPDLTLHSG